MHTKISPIKIIYTHYNSYINCNTKKIRWQDHMIFSCMPILSIILCFILQVKMQPVVISNFIIFTVMISAISFILMLYIANVAIDFLKTMPKKGVKTSSYAIYLEELSANAGYTFIMSLLTIFCFIMASTNTNIILNIFSAFSIGLFIHIILILFMMIKRIFAFTVQHLNYARTGEKIT